MLLCLLLIVSGSFAQDTGKLIKAETMRFAAMIGKDSAALERIIDDGLVYIHSNNIVQDKKDFIGSILQNKLVYHSIEPRERKIRLYKNTAIINGIVHVKGVLNGNEFETELRYTDVMIWNKNWKLASWQSLKIN